jgi:hypothetical protein
MHFDTPLDSRDLPLSHIVVAPGPPPADFAFLIDYAPKSR